MPFRFFPKAVIRLADEFKRNCKGVAAIEFALIAPILLVLLIGTAETVTALNHKRKVAQVTSTVADLVAQVSSVSESDLNDIMDASGYILTPYSANGLKIAVASVTFDSDGAPVVDWFRTNITGTMSWVQGAEPPVDIPAALAIPDASIVVSETELIYTPLFASLIQNIFPRATTIFMNDVAFMTPRLATKVEGP